MALPGNLGELTLNTIGEAIAFAAGVALSPTLAPVAHAIEQEAWKVAPILAVDPGTSAGIAAERVSEYQWAADQAIQHGIAGDSFQKIYQEALNAPGFGELVRMLRRKTISPDQFVHGLNKLKLEDMWDAPLTDLQTDRLDPAVIAVSGQRGTMDDAGLLPVGPPSEVGLVPPMPVSPLDTLAEAAASGISPDRLAVMMRNVGLPASPDLAARMLFRAIIEQPDFFRAIAEGNTRNEWAPFLLDGFREILTANQYAELELRGYYDETTRRANTAKHGMSEQDSDLLYNVLGRSINVHAITTALERGGNYPGSYANVPSPYKEAIQRSNIREEYAELAYANRFTYPSAFVLRALAQAGELGNTDDVKQILLEIGWKPDLAAKVALAWVPAASKGDTHVTKAQTQLWTATHKAYIDDLADTTQARSTFTLLDVPEEAQTEVLKLWDAERAVRRGSLTVKQITDAIGQPGHDRAWATTLLSDRGYSDDEISALLGPVPPATSTPAPPVA